MYRSAPENDDARPEKADAGNDLGRHTRGVDLDCARNEDIAESVLAHQQDERRGRADDGLRADAGRFALQFAFQPDEGGQAEGDEQLDDLPDPLSGPAEERRVGRQPEIHANKLAPVARGWSPARRANSPKPSSHLLTVMLLRTSDGSR